MISEFCRHSADECSLVVINRLTSEDNDEKASDASIDRIALSIAPPFQFTFASVIDHLFEAARRKASTKNGRQQDNANGGGSHRNVNRDDGSYSAVIQRGCNLLIEMRDAVRHQSDL
jgi:hypothetical protein